MDVERASRRHLYDVQRKDLPVCDDDRDVGRDGLKLREELRPTRTARLQDGDPFLDRDQLHGRRVEPRP